jgi:hypothetical protein
VTTWTLPPEPGPEVTHVQDGRFGATWERCGRLWAGDPLKQGYPEFYEWPHLLALGRELTDVTDEETR